MTPFSRLMSRATVAIAAAAALALAGCSHYDVKTRQQVQSMSSKFNTVVAAYKSGQFTLDGGVVSSADLGSHFAYLKDQGDLPKRVLLVPSEDSKITHQHLAYMARMALDYGFAIYYDKNGQLVKVEAKQSNAAKRLSQSVPTHKSEADREVEQRGAAHNPYAPANPADQGGGG